MAHSTAANSSVCQSLSSPLAVARHDSAPHLRVDAFFDQAVEDGGRTGHQPDAQAGGERQPHVRQPGHAGHGQHHADERAEHDQLDHARLGQRVELPQARRHAEASRGCAPASAAAPARLSQQRPGQHHHQRRSPAGVRHGDRDRPAEHDVRQPRGELPERQRGDPCCLPAQGAAALQRPGRDAQRRQHRIGDQAVDIVDGGQRGEIQVLARARHAQRAPQLEALPQVHVRPPAALAGRKVGAGEHSVVGADPATQRRLQPHQRQRRQQPGPRGWRDGCAATALLRMLVRDGLATKQCQQHEPAQQVQRHDGREQFHGHRPGAEGALQANPGEGRRGHHGLTGTPRRRCSQLAAASVTISTPTPVAR